jgi:long-chain fatty acid transport protein
MLQRYKINGQENSDNIFVSSSPGSVTNNGYEYSSGLSFTIGWQWQVLPCLKVGASFRPKTGMGHFDKYKGLVADAGKIDYPRVIILGVAYNPTPCVLLAFDVQQFWLQDIPTSHNLSEFIGIQTGRPNGPGAGLHNSVTLYKAGAEYYVTDCLALRAGFVHFRNPVKSTQTFPNLVHANNVENVGTLGFTWEWNCFELSLAYNHGFNNEIIGEPNGIPAALGGGKVDLRESTNLVAISLGSLF